MVINIEEIYHHESEIEKLALMNPGLLESWDLEVPNSIPQEGIEFPNYITTTNTIIDYEDSLYEELSNLSPVARLNDVKQLGIACYCGNTGGDHARYTHSLSVATKLDYLSQLHGFDREIAVSAGMLHDIATPPYSDSVSNGVQLDDQENFSRVLENHQGALDFLSKHDISKERLIRMVKGEDETPLGQLVSSKGSIDVDRWCYVKQDAKNFWEKPRGLGDEYFANPFKFMDVVEDQVVFKNVEEVRRFLRAREYMFTHFYKSEQLMAKEGILEKGIRDMWEKDFLNEDNLFEMTDRHFDSMFKEKKPDLYQTVFSITSQRAFECYGELDGSRERVEEFLSENTKELFSVKEDFEADPAVRTPVMVRGEVLPYEKADPSVAKILKESFSSDGGTFVFGYRDNPGLKNVVSEAVEEFGGFMGTDIVTFERVGNYFNPNSSSSQRK